LIESVIIYVMKINIKATGTELTQSIRGYVNKKISAVEKHIGVGSEDVLAQVDVGVTTHRHKAGNIFRAEVHITGGGLDLYADSEQEDLYAAIDVVKDEIIHALEHSKERRITLTRRGAEMVKYMMKGLKNFRRKR